MLLACLRPLIIVRHTFHPIPSYTRATLTRVTPPGLGSPFSTHPTLSMPELPEAERARRLLADTIKGGLITRVETVEDTIVFEGVGHEEFAREMEGRRVRDVKRHGKVFWLELDEPASKGKVDGAGEKSKGKGEKKEGGKREGEGVGGRHPVFHLGMTGMIQIRGSEPTWYRVRPKDTESWPPRFMKFIMHITPPKPRTEEVQFAFMDARRLGRIRLRSSPRTEPPVSELGFDPVLSHPTLPEFSELVLRRNMPIKALLLDQSFSAGVGNWVADEVLYHGAIHPERRANGLEEEEVKRLWEMVRWVCEEAVRVNADASLFPKGWLFAHRWGKGKKWTHDREAKDKMLLPDGKPATIKWITVGGRTSAYVEEVQKLGKGEGGVKKVVSRKRKVKKEDGDEEEVEEVEDLEVAPKGKRTKTTVKTEVKSTGAKRTRKVKVQVEEEEEDEDEDEDERSEEEAEELAPVKKGRGRGSNVAVWRVNGATEATTRGKQAREEVEVKAEDGGRRRSARLSRG